MCVYNRNRRCAPCTLNCLPQRIAMVSFIVCLCFSTTYGQRRIVNGTLSVGEPKYLAYFVKASQSTKQYTGWVCGGSIIHPLYILTSAACLDDVKHVYAITGYYRYVRSEDIDKDECTKRTKKRVVARSFQREYKPKPGAHNWSYRDISLAKVESPYNFRDPVYITYCSYAPVTIRVNFHSNFELPGTEAVVFGWGHKNYFRSERDTKDHNMEFVNYASTVVIDKELCKDLLIGHADIKKHVHNYLLCTLGPGILDENGKINDSATSRPGILDETEKINDSATLGPSILDENGKINDSANLRPGILDENEKINDPASISSLVDCHNSSVVYMPTSTTPNNSFEVIRNRSPITYPWRHNPYQNTTPNDSFKALRSNGSSITNHRRYGPCQNDHGGPLITWIGGREYVIGVACGFQVNRHMECVGPYLYSSTFSNGEFIYCMLRYTRRSRLCDVATEQKGYQIIEETIEWNKNTARSSNFEEVVPEIEDPKTEMPNPEIEKGL